MSTSLNTTPCSTHKSTTTSAEINKLDDLLQHPLDSHEAFGEFLDQLEHHQPIFIILRDKKRAEPQLLKAVAKSEASEGRVIRRGAEGGAIISQTIRLLKYLVTYRLPRLVLRLVEEECGVTRRRLSEIFAVLESLTISKKIGYGSYEWFGLRAARSTLRDYQTKYGIFFKDVKIHSEMMDIASATIKLFEYESTTWRFNDLVDRIMGQSDKGSSKNCKKRVYSVLAIFKVLGLVVKGKCQKVGKYFAWMGIEGYDKFLERLEDHQDSSIDQSPAAIDS